MATLIKKSKETKQIFGTYPVYECTQAGMTHSNPDSMLVGNLSSEKVVCV